MLFVEPNHTYTTSKRRATEHMELRRSEQVVTKEAQDKEDLLCLKRMICEAQPLSRSTGAYAQSALVLAAHKGSLQALKLEIERANQAFLDEKSTPKR